MLLHTPPCEFGLVVPDFELKTGDDISYSLKDIVDENGAVIAFISNHCPFVIQVAEQISSVADELEKLGVGFVAVMPNNYQYVELDSPPNMLKFATRYDFNFPYVVDEDQSIAKAYGAVCTPDFFGVNSDSELQYRGRIEEGDLLSAMTEISKTGRGPKQQRPSKGCSIKWR